MFVATAFGWPRLNWFPIEGSQPAASGIAWKSGVNPEGDSRIEHLEPLGRLVTWLTRGKFLHTETWMNLRLVSLLLVDLASPTGRSSDHLLRS
jgi:hypothetical protein